MTSRPTDGSNDFDTLSDCLKILCVTTGENIPLTTFTKIMDLIERCEEEAFNDWRKSTIDRTKYWWQRRYQEWENNGKSRTFNPARVLNLRKELPAAKKSQTYEEMLTPEDRKFLKIYMISSGEPEKETPA